MTTILLCDDEPFLLDLIAEELKELGYKVLTAGSGNEGLEILKNNQVDIIISDVNMPNGKGTSLINNMRDVPIIFVSGFVDADMEIIGNCPIINKPITDFSQLEYHIKRLLSNKK